MTNSNWRAVGTFSTRADADLHPSMDSLGEKVLEFADSDISGSTLVDPSLFWDVVIRFKVGTSG